MQPVVQGRRLSQARIWGEIAINGQLARCEVMVLCGIKVALSVFDHCTEDVRECRHS